MFSVRFLLCNLVLTILLGFFLLIKKVFRRSLTAGSQYSFWYVFSCAALLPFLPYKITGPAKMLAKLQTLFSAEAPGISGPTSEPVGGASLPERLGVSDFAASYSHSSLLQLNKVLTLVWIIGCFITALYFIHHIRAIYRIRKSACRITPEAEPELYRQYTACMQELCIKHSIPLYASCHIASPVSYGLLRPRIIIPQDLDILLSESDLRFIFLHELQHCKRRDAALNNLACLIQTLYWFNPLLWYGFRVFQRDREIACDRSVLCAIDKDQAGEYGHTLLRYAQSLQSHAFFSPLSRFGCGKKVLLMRIREIAAYKADTPDRKRRSVCFLALACAAVYCFAPLLSVSASRDSTYEFSSQDVEIQDFSAYFKGTDGTFVLYDLAADHYQIYNQKLSAVRRSPDSTFKIYSGLFALEEGLISPDSSGQTWDGTSYFFDSWNQDQTLATAMQNSVNWYFQSLDAQLGLQKLTSYYQTVSYGNCDLSGGSEHYWAESSLKISPTEQVMLLAGLIRNEWGFAPENIQAVKDALYISDTPFGTLYGKTGTGLTDGKDTNGWFVGFLEQNDRTYCFATNLQAADHATGSAASEITLDILQAVFAA